MGAPSQEQIDECIADGLARQLDEDSILAECAELERMTDEELAAIGVVRREIPDALSEPAPTVPFTPVPTRRRVDGWTAERQREFIAALAETGCVSEACAEVGLTPRSAYSLRQHPKGEAFRAAWDHAQALATVRLTALAWERAVHGTADRLYRNGELVAERRAPNDRLLMWLLAHHNPGMYGWAAKPPATAPDMSFFPVEHARAEYPAAIAGLRDVSAEDCPTENVSVRDLNLIEEPDSRA
jgi:hypothetical protein